MTDWLKDNVYISLALNNFHTHKRIFKAPASQRRPLIFAKLKPYFCLLALFVFVCLFANSFWTQLRLAAKTQTGRLQRSYLNGNRAPPIHPPTTHPHRRERERESKTERERERVHTVITSVTTSLPQWQQSPIHSSTHNYPLAPAREREGERERERERERGSRSTDRPTDRQKQIRGRKLL